MMKNKKAKTVVKYAFIVTIALMFSYLEAKLPSFVAVPGVKLGLTNSVVLVVLYLYGEKSAFAVNFLRIALVSLLFGSAIGFVYSFAGGMLSTASMVLMKKLKKFRIVTVSITGGIMHNVGQITAAMILLKTSSVGWYLPVLWFSGLVSGAAIGVVSGIMCKKLKKIDGNFL